MKTLRKYFAHFFFAAFFVLSFTMAYLTSFTAHLATPDIYRGDKEDYYQPHQPQEPPTPTQPGDRILQVKV